MPNSDKGKAQLQELYLHLDGVEPAGNMRLAWYGQLRAEEYSHADALRMTIERFRLEEKDWYQLRVRRENERQERDRQVMERARQGAKR